MLRGLLRRREQRKRLLARHDPRELEGISLYAVFEAANRVEARTVPRTP
jgi:hypothetical protein